MSDAFETATQVAAVSTSVGATNVSLDVTGLQTILDGGATIIGFNLSAAGLGGNTFTNPTLRYEQVAAAVPLPAGVLLLGTGIALLAGWRAHRDL